MKIIQKTLPVFTLAQFSVVGLFIFVMAMMFVRLSEVRNALNELTSQSVPSLSKASKLTHEIQHLVTLTSIIAHSQNESSRRLSKLQIDESLLRLKSPLFQLQTKDEFIYIQLMVLSQEIEELNRLIVERIEIEKNLEEKTIVLLNYMSSTFFELDNAQVDLKQRTALSALFLYTAQVGQQNRLHDLRRLANIIYTDIAIIRKFNSTNVVYLEAVDKLETMLLDNDGLINKKIETLRIVGRVRGRGNFVRNLVEDLAKNIHLQSDLVRERALQEGKEATLQVAEQTRLVFVSAVIVVVISLLFIYYLYKRIVVRLISLTTQVENSASQESKIISLEGNDEIALLAKTFSRYLQKVKSQEQDLLKLTLSDPLTGIPNRRAFEDGLIKNIALARRNSWHLSILMIDVDYFKGYNDYYGHHQGDEALKRIANELNNSVKRHIDLCARFGGEEFIVLLPSTDANSAKGQAEQLRLNVEALALPHKKSDVSSIITVSIGIASFEFTNNSTFTADLLIESADRALYKAKSGGRNRCSYTDSVL